MEGPEAIGASSPYAPGGPRPPARRWHLFGAMGVAVALVGIVMKILVFIWLVNIDLAVTHAGVWTYALVYGLVAMFAGFAMRWTSWSFGLLQVLYNQLYEEVGSCLIRLGTALSFVAGAGILVVHYLF